MLTASLRLACAAALLLSGCTIQTSTSYSSDPDKASGGDAPKDTPKKDEPKPAEPKKDEPAKPAEPKPAEPKPEAKPAKPKPSEPAKEPKPDVPVVAKPDPKDEPKVPPAPEPAQPERSTIVLPIRIALSALEKEIDALVPKTDKRDWHQVTKGSASPKAELTYELWREPIELALDGQTFKIQVPVRYAATIRADAKNPLTRKWFSLTKGETWGTRSEPQRITAHFEAKLRVTDDWRIQSDLKLVKLEHGAAPSGDICKNVGVTVCMPKSSIAGEVREAIDAKLEPKLRSALEKVDAKIEGAFDLKKRAATIWKAMQVPHALPGTSDRAWLVLRPSAAAVSQPGKDGGDVRIDVALEGRLSVESGEKPKVAPAPLPDVSKVDGAPGFHVIAPLELKTAVLGKTLERELKGLAFTGRAHPKLAIERVRLSAGRDPRAPERLSLSVVFGDGSGDEIELSGSLRYDAAKQRLSIVGLELTTASRSAAKAKLAGADFDALAKKLSTKAHWDLGAQSAELRGAIEAALGASLRGGQASVQGKLDRLDVRKLELTDDVLKAELILGGQLAVAVGR